MPEGYDTSSNVVAAIASLAIEIVWRMRCRPNMVPPNMAPPCAVLPNTVLPGSYAVGTTRQVDPFQNADSDRWVAAIWVVAPSATQLVAARQRTSCR